MENAAQLQAALEAVENFDGGQSLSIPAIITMANDITMLGDVTLSTNKSINVNGYTLNMAGSVIDVNGYSLGIEGSIVEDGSFVSGSAAAEGPRGRVLISGTVTLNNVVFESLDADDDLTILGTVQGSNIEIGPTPTNAVKLTDVTLDGGVTLTSVNAADSTVTVGNAASLELALGAAIASITLGADIEVANGATLAITAGSAFVLDGAEFSLVDATGGSGTVTLGNNATTRNLTIATTGANATAAATTVDNVTFAEDFVVAGGHTLTLAGDITIEENKTLTAGAAISGSGTISGDGDLILNAGGNLTNVTLAVDTAVNGAVTFNGVSSSEEITIAEGVTLTLDSDLTASGAITGSDTGVSTVGGAGDLILNAGGDLTNVTLVVDTVANEAVTFSGVTTAATITLADANLTFADSADLAGATFVFGGTGVLSGAVVATEKLIESVAANATSAGTESTIVVSPLDEWGNGNTFTISAAILTLDGNSGNDSVASTGGETLSLSGTGTVTVTIDIAPTTATAAITYTVDEDVTGLLTAGETITVVRDGVTYQVNAQ